MSKSDKGITDVDPRENVGRDTGLRFEYQYRQAAEAALELLEDKEVVCVYCNYQDDYVIHRRSETTEVFDFVQVKSKKDKKYQWDFGEVFGINETKKTPKTKPPKSFAGKLFYHQLHFDKSCKSVSVLTNVFFIDHIDALIRDVSKAKSVKDLTGNSKTWFDKISVAYSEAFNSVNTDLVFSFIQKLKLRENANPLQDEKNDHAAIFLSRIYQYSEIPLTQPQGLKIYKELIALVRARSIKEIPFNIKEGELKTLAGITLKDLLSVLSISESGYKILKSGEGAQTLLQTSRLERFLTDCGDKTMIDLACTMKVNWDNWIRSNRHIIGELDLITMSQQCIDLIRSHNKVKRTLTQLSDECSEIAKNFSGKINHPLTKDLVFGLFLSLIAKGIE